MRVLVKRPSMSIGGDIHRKGDTVETTEEEVRKKLKRYPGALEILQDLPKPKKRGRPKKRDESENEAFVDG